MKTICLKVRKNWSFWYLTIFAVISMTANANAAMWTITVQSFEFSPAALTTVHVGDTIKFQWLNGNHTTTSTTIPGGAASWDSPMTSSTPVFMYKVTVPGLYNYWCTPHSPDMAGSFTATMPSGISNESGVIPSTFDLKQNYPNPFNPSTNIKFSLPEGSFVTLKVYNMLGKEVVSLVNGELQAGAYTYDWNAANLNSGIYMYRIEAVPSNGSEKFLQTKRMMLIK